MNLIIREDGFINATALCKVGGKKFSHWYRLESTIELLKYYKKYTDINLLYITKGRYGMTWAHPLIITNISQWISPEFSVKVSLWIEEWKQINNNKSIYENEIINIKPDKNIQKEKEIQLRLQKELRGEIEVETDSGFIDLLTDTEIIEIKTGKNWKEAVGQILMYSLDYPKHTKRIHLFDIEYNKNINNKCKIYNIKVSYE